MPAREEAKEKSVALLHGLQTTSGFLASKENVENYERVWARDGVIAGLASLLVDNASLIETFKQTLITLETHQDETGRIPSNVVPSTGKTSYGTTVGRIDATLWYVIGVCAVAAHGGDRAFFDAHKASVDRALFYLDCLELNGRGLLYIPQGGDWADEYINHGYVLFDEMLYYIALSAYAAQTNNQKTLAKRDHLRALIRINYFPTAAHKDNPLVYHPALYAYALHDYTPPLPAAYFTNHSIRFHVDAFAISLLLLSDVIDQEARESVRASLRATYGHNTFPIIPAFHPVITPESPEWEHLRLNFLYEFRNKPNQYHNGGLWPLVHGFFLASSPKIQGLEELDAFAEVLARDGYIFPEYYHGETFEALGTRSLGFSASAYLIAYEAVVHGKTPFISPAS
ncbi:MAG: hypothetical protein B7X04_03500 [Parcubacteria group bacterium 21-54-25]|nr:MAG: hypothetical protein B7X04_03500 [Parcubacteria group bacterium 21-54-25]HQU08053.1 glycogen debranching protein [Candidatus Paceibacterota bacterium]